MNVSVPVGGIPGSPSESTEVVDSEMAKLKGLAPLHPLMDSRQEIFRLRGTEPLLMPTG